MAFPISPTNGQVATVNNIVYVYNSAENSWTRVTSGIGANVNLNNKSLYNVSNVQITDTTISTSSTTGALVVAGGVGIAGELYIAATGDVAANIGSYQTYANANLGTATTNITTLFGNAASQAVSINSINANLGVATIDIAGLKSNAAIQANLIDVLTGNAATQGSLLDVLVANAAEQSNSLITLTANAASQEANLAVLVGNAASQATAINTFDANLGTATTNITTLFSNAASQAVSINTVNANIGAFITYANTKIGTNTNGNLVIEATTNSTSSTTGALVVAGGIGAGGDITVQGKITVPTVVALGGTYTNGDTFADVAIAIPTGDYIYSQHGTSNLRKIIGHDGSKIVIGQTGTALISSVDIIGGNAGGVNLYHAGTIKLATTSAGASLTGNLVPTSNVSSNLGSPTAWFDTFYGVATQAQYADLAENYIADNTYTPGTVLVFGGDKEVTVTKQSHDTRVAGIVSTNPAYLMNAASGNTAVALTGRVPCWVQGPVYKGTVIVTSNTAGVAQAINNSMYAPGCVIGKCLEEIPNNSTQLIEVAVGRF